MPSVTLHGPAGLSLLVTQGGRAPGIYPPTGGVPPAYLGGVTDQTIENNTTAGTYDLGPRFSNTSGGAWSVVTTPPTGGITIDVETGVVTYDSWPLPEGSWSVAVTVTTGAGAATADLFTVTVTPDATAPVPGTETGDGALAAPSYHGTLSDVTVPPSTTITAITAGDAFSGGDLVFSATGLPPGLSIDAATGAITGTTGATTATYSAMVTATNSGGTASGTFDITVGT